MAANKCIWFIELVLGAKRSTLTKVRRKIIQPPEEGWINLLNIFATKGLFFYETRQKIFSLLGGKTEFEFWPLRQCWAVGPIQI